MHCLMYAVSLSSELSELRAQYQNNPTLIKYYSDALKQIQLFVEFFFEVINERCEPLVCLFEVVKAFCRAREYWKLQNQEGIKVYLGLETYKGLKESKEYEASMLNLIRSKK